MHQVLLFKNRKPITESKQSSETNVQPFPCTIIEYRATLLAGKGTKSISSNITFVWEVKEGRKKI